jgi:threonine dehydratase
MLIFNEIGIQLTSCKLSPILSKRMGYELYLKKDYRQITGSFKERGARNALLLLSEEEKKNGVVAASAGMTLPSSHLLLF